MELPKDALGRLKSDIDEQRKPRASPLTEVKQMLNGDAEEWGAVPLASTSFKRPSEWSPAARLAQLFKTVQHDEARLAAVFREAEPLARQMFAKVVPLIEKATRRRTRCSIRSRSASAARWSSIPRF